MNVPTDLKYTKTHEWIRIEGDTVTIGITDYAQSELGDIVYVDLPEAGKILQPGQSICTVESVKTVSDVYTPIGGEIIATNPDLEGSAELINQDPYSKGWIAKLKMDGSPSGLLDFDGYKAVLEAK